MPNARARGRRRTAGIATIVGGAIAAVLMNWMGFGSTHKVEPAPSSAPKISQTQNRSVPPEASAASFEFYTLALSLAPAFCETSPDKKQCRKLTDALNAATPLTLHGLWPENARPGSYPELCAGAGITLTALERNIDARRLRQFMPGIVDGLASHEWRKHGTCTGLTANVYFLAAIDWSERVNAALASTLKLASGKQIAAAALKSAANRVFPGLGQAMTLHCRNIKTQDANMRGKPVLIELHVCLQKGANGVPEVLTECAAFDRIDQGCGDRFVLDGV